MRIGIKYCGGCNPRYRRESVEETIAKVAGRENIFYIYDSDDGFDVLFVICGCETACVKVESGAVFVTRPLSEEEVAELLSRLKGDNLEKL
ncbi:MAG: hypothetical protein ABWW66_06555 [Archaeoglobaceae archaeon]